MFLINEVILVDILKSTSVVCKFWLWIRNQQYKIPHDTEFWYTIRLQNCLFFNRLKFFLSVLKPKYIGNCLWKIKFDVNQKIIELWAAI